MPSTLCIYMIPYPSLVYVYVCFAILYYVRGKKPSCMINYGCFIPSRIVRLRRHGSGLIYLTNQRHIICIYISWVSLLIKKEYSGTVFCGTCHDYDVLDVVSQVQRLVYGGLSRTIVAGWRTYPSVPMCCGDILV